MSDDLLTDEEAIANEPTREELLTRGANPNPRKLRSIKLRPATPESMSYLWELKNMFVYRDEEGRVVRNNPILAVAEFVYIHAADIDEVAENLADKKTLREAVRAYMNGPLAGLTMMNEAVPVIEGMIAEYAAAQSEIDAKSEGKAKGVLPGKGQARAGKRPTSR